MDYASWEQTVPETLAGDPLWRMKVYRFALFITDIGWQDMTQLVQDKRTHSLSDQLYRALGSIGVNIAEGYSRSSQKDRTRFYEYALGSAREARDWYYKARHVLAADVVENRMSIATEIIRLLLTTLVGERGNMIKEEAADYCLTDDTRSW